MAIPQFSNIPRICLDPFVQAQRLFFGPRTVKGVGYTSLE
jgi:hypothetical protein